MSDPAGALFSTPRMHVLFSAEAHVQRMLLWLMVRRRFLFRWIPS